MRTLFFSLILMSIIILSIPADASLSAPTSYGKGYKIWGNYWDGMGEYGDIRNGTSSMRDWNYLITQSPWNNSVIAINGTDGRVEFTNPTGDASQVYNSTLAANASKSRIVFASGSYNWSTSVIFPNQTNLVETVGMGYVRLVANTSMNAMISYEGDKGYTGTGVSAFKRNYKNTFNNIRFDCNNNAITALNLSQPEQALMTTVSSVETTKCASDNYAIIMDGNEDSVIRDSVIHSGNVKFYAQYGDAYIQNTFIGGNLTASAQQVILESTTLANISYVASSFRDDTLSLKDVYFNLPDPDNDIIVVSSSLDDLIMDNVYMHAETSHAAINTTGSGAITRITLGRVVFVSSDNTATSFINGSVTNVIGAYPTLVNGAIWGNNTLNSQYHGILQNGNRMDVLNDTIADFVWIRQRGNDSALFMGFGNRSDGRPYTAMKDTQFDTSVKLPQVRGDIILNGTTYWNGTSLFVNTGSAWRVVDSRAVGGDGT